MSNIWLIGIPAPLALALVALVGYHYGRRNRRRIRLDHSQTRRELERAKTLIGRLNSIAQEVRRSLAAHHAGLLLFQERINNLSSQRNQEAWDVLCGHAEEMLAPTEALSKQIAHAYDEIRQQTNLLLTFAEIRTDPLTGLSNRRALDESIESLFQMMARYSTAFSLAVFDIDHFKRINNEHGHLRGDEVLQQFARFLDVCARETDVVARYGGEEFVVVMPETDQLGAALFAKRVQRGTAEKLDVTVSGGVAMALDGDTPASLLGRADSALYAAKAAGRNCVCSHLGTQIEPVTDRLENQQDDEISSLEPGELDDRLPDPAEYSLDEARLGK